MWKILLCALAVLLVLSSLAQTPVLPATDVTNSDIQSFINALPRDVVSDKAIRIVDVGGYHLGVFGVFRPKTIKQEANLHQTKVTEIYYILDGSATLVTGGTLPDPHPLRAGSTTFQSTKIEGGVSRHVTKGDVIVTPARPPHWFSSQDGHLRYLIFRPDAESTLALK